MQYADYYASSFLSPYAKKLLHICGHVEDTLSDCDCVNKNGMINFEKLYSHFEDNLRGKDFVSSLSAINHTFALIGKRFSFVPVNEFATVYASKLSWLYTIEEYISILELFQSTRNDKSLLIILRLTALLEYSFSHLLVKGDSARPNNMKSILIDERLIKKIGIGAVSLLTVLFGPVSSLNLRTLAWHGFLSPSDIQVINQNFILFLLNIPVSIGYELERNATPNISSPLRELSKLQMCSNLCSIIQRSPSSAFYHCTSLRELVLKHNVNQSSIKEYILSIDELSSEQPVSYKNLLCLTLVCLNVLVRIEFSRVIGWLGGVFTSECRFFLTMDSILRGNLERIIDQPLSFRAWQEFSAHISGELLLLLSGLLVAESGPRIQERLSHGEIFETTDLSVSHTLWPPMAQLLFDCLTSLLLKTGDGSDSLHQLSFHFHISPFNLLYQFIEKSKRLFSVYEQFSDSIKCTIDLEQIGEPTLKTLTLWFPELDVRGLLEHHLMTNHLPTINTSYLWLWKLYSMPSFSRSYYETKQPSRLIRHLIELQVQLTRLISMFEGLISEKLSPFDEELCVGRVRTTRQRVHDLIPHLANFLPLILVCFTAPAIWNHWLGGRFFDNDDDSHLIQFVVQNPYTFTKTYPTFVKRIEMTINKLIAALIKRDLIKVQDILDKFKLPSV